MLSGLLALWAAERAYMVAWVGAAAAMARARGLGETTVCLGMGPAVVRVGRLRVGAIPLGGWVKPEADATMPVLVAPHLALGIVAWVAAGPGALGPPAAWLAGLVGVGEVRLGLFHALWAVVLAAAEAPLAIAFATWAWLGITNAAMGLVQGGLVRAGAAGRVAFVGIQLGLAALLVRAVALDL